MHIPFNIPVAPDAEWQILEKIIHEALESRGASDAMRDAVSERMKAAWEESAFEYQFPIQEGNEDELKAVLDLHSAMKQHVTRLLFSRLLLEVELAQAKGVE
ncbi:MAG: hypothetical protein CMI09_02150 [Oceanospirillaceae bacterium]|nr:hypothetical protein [Oceanospirillaceae bacterium]|tara:strand:+ start:264 stop:569 length:306 start_codon:yes stop_codon:yes gene_type:complete